MAVLARLGLRARLAVALVTVAAISVGTATALSNRGLPGRVDAAAEARLEREATHLAAVAAAFHSDEGRWTAEHVAAVEHLGQMGNVAVELTAGGRRLSSRPLGGPPEATAAVVVRGRRVATLAVRPAGSGALTPEEEHLRHSLDRLHFVAAGISVAVALALAFLLAQRMAAPLRRLRRGAEQLAAGRLDARVPVAGGPEAAAVARALNGLAETLRGEEELRKESVADLAHELRTPVNGLLGRIEAAQDGVLEPRRNLAAMHTEALRLSRLLDDLARLADAEQPALLVEKTDVDLDAVVSAAVERWRPRFAARRIGLGCDLGPVTLPSDPDRLAQIVDNLLGNALRYTDEGGTVRLRVGADGDAAVLEVADDGIGIAAADLPHVFERFWRGEKSRSRATGGAGIGLAIVAALAEAHGGRVEVESEPGRGSTFRVLLSLGEPPSRDRRTAFTSRPHATATME